MLPGNPLFLSRIGHRTSPRDPGTSQTMSRIMKSNMRGRGGRVYAFTTRSLGLPISVKAAILSCSPDRPAPARVRTFLDKCYSM
jgi:hypothetical protein